MSDRRVLVDFDHTICPDGDINKPPSGHCLAFLTMLRGHGCEIIIFSVRSNPAETRKPGGHQQMLDYLDKYSVPYDEFHVHKVGPLLIIDDRCAGIPLDANRNVDWKKLMLRYMYELPG